MCYVIWLHGSCYMSRFMWYIFRLHICIYIHIYIYIYIYISSASSSLCSHSVPWLGEGLSMLLPHLPILRYPLPDCSSSRLVVSLTFRRSSCRSFPFVVFPGGDTQCPSVILYHAGVPSPDSLPSSDLFNHVRELGLFSYPDVCFFCPEMWCLTYSFPSLFVWLLACSLHIWWVPVFLRRMSLLEIRMSCRFVSSDMFQC